MAQPSHNGLLVTILFRDLPNLIFVIWVAAADLPSCAMIGYCDFPLCEKFFLSTVVSLPIRLDLLTLLVCLANTYRKKLPW